MKLFDTHCHLQFRAYDEDREEVIGRARAAGVRMLVVGTELQSSRAACELAEGQKDMRAAVGLHPNHLFSYPHDEQEEHAVSTEDFSLAEYRKLAQNPVVSAIGECGLDFYRIPENLDAREVKKKQELVFREHLNLADELGLPVIVHCRDAHEPAALIIGEYANAGKLARRGVIHCFTGTAEEAKRYLELGFFISFTGIITFAPKKGQDDVLAETVRSIPIERILVETDAPYLAPAPYRGGRNEPAYVLEVTARVAQIKGISFEEAAQITTDSAEQLFLSSAERVDN